MDRKIRVALNGFGQIGIRVFKFLWDMPEIEIVGVRVPPASMHDRKIELQYNAYDGEWLGHSIEAEDSSLVIDGKEVPFYEAVEGEFWWGGLDTDVIIENSGKCKKNPKALQDIAAGTRKLIVTYPALGVDAMFVMGVNHHRYDPKQHQIISNASCTTNCAAPILYALKQEFPNELRECAWDTVHAATASQKILTSLDQILSYTTGADRALGGIFPDFSDYVIASASRVPTPEGSQLKLYCIFGKPSPSPEAIGDALMKASATYLKDIMRVIDIPLKKDCNGFHRYDEHSAIVNLQSIAGTRKGTMRSLYAWYNNAHAYSKRVCDLVLFIAEREGWIDRCTDHIEDDPPRPEYQNEVKIQV